MSWRRKCSGSGGTREDAPIQCIDQVIAGPFARNFVQHGTPGPSPPLAGGGPVRVFNFEVVACVWVATSTSSESARRSLALRVRGLCRFKSLVGGRTPVESSASESRVADAVRGFKFIGVLAPVATA